MLAFRTTQVCILTSLFFLAPWGLYGDEVLTVKEHETFCAEVIRDDAIDATLAQYKKELDDLDEKYPVIASKSEFETTKEYQARVQAANDANQKRKAERHRVIYADAIAFGKEIDKLKVALNHKENGLAELVVCIRVTVGTYDADIAKFTSLNPELCLLGSYGEHVAAVKTAFQLSGGLLCPPANARLLSEASNKGELYCVIRLKNPKLAIEHTAIELPLSTGDKVGHFFGKLGLAIMMNSVNPSQTDAAVNSVPNPTTKSLDAYVIRLDSSESLEYLKFLDGSSVIYDK